MLVAAAINGIGTLLGQSLQLRLFESWILPALSFTAPSGQQLLPGIALNVLGAVSGVLTARALMQQGGRLRVLGRRRLVFNLNARVWNWFLQEPTPGGRLYRVTLKKGRQMVGQIAHYSVDPNDDVQDVVMEGYSVVEDGKLRPVKDAKAALINRADIELIEELEYVVATDGTITINGEPYAPPQPPPQQRP